MTSDEWKACVDGGGCKSNKSPEDEDYGRGRRPVMHISWNNAKEYVAWLSRKTGKPYRLLSDSEWEYAARGGSTTIDPWGDVIGARRIPVCVAILKGQRLSARSSRTALASADDCGHFTMYRCILRTTQAMPMHRRMVRCGQVTAHCALCEAVIGTIRKKTCEWHVARFTLPRTRTVTLAFAWRDRCENALSVRRRHGFGAGQRW